MALQQVLNDAQSGAHVACMGCPWNPRVVGPIAFGTSCRTHGVDWAVPGSAISVQIVRDPGGTTPERTGTLCFECNKATPSDRTAQNNSALWAAAVAAGETRAGAAKMLRGHYWTNAVMHGSTGALSEYLELARQHCKGVLRDQINSLLPKVIIASGQDAAESLFEIGVLTRRWASFRHGLGTAPYREHGVLLGKQVEVFVTYHTSAGVVNRTVSRLYSSETERLLESALGTLPAQDDSIAFLSRNLPSSATGRGLRVLLLHWIQIGHALRAAAK